MLKLKKLHLRKHAKIAKIGIGLAVILTAVGLAGCTNVSSKQSANNQSHPDTSNAVPKNTAYLANLNYKQGTSAVKTLNHNKAQLKTNWTSDHVNYSRLDKYQRTSFGNTGWLDKKNVVGDKQRTRQTFEPTGWHQKRISGQPIINRGHEIAYSLSGGIDQFGKYNPKRTSGDQNNPKNLFTQTAFCNQKLQTIYESKVRRALEHGEKVVYQVQPIFQGKDDMAKGVHMQAVSTNHKLDYNVYLFNVQQGVKFNYQTGRSTIDHQMKIPTPKGAPSFNNNRGNQRTYNSYDHGYRRYRRHGMVRRVAGGYAKYRVYRHFARRHYYNKYRRNRPYKYYRRYRSHRF